MRRQMLYVTLPVFAVIMGEGAWVAMGGPLDPPPGPVASTGRFGPRTEISDATTPGDADSLFKITQPGSYYLTGNITGEAGKNGIEIAADDVTLDLMGFSLVGVGDSLSAVAAPAAQAGITVQNGTVRNWEENGIHLSAATGCRVTDVTAQGAFVGYAIQLGNESTITHCRIANGYPNSALVVGDHCAVSQCVSYSSALGGGGSAIFAGTDCVITDSVAFGGQYPLEVGGDSVVSNCSIGAGDQLSGVSAGDRCTLTDCSIAGSVSLGSRCTMINCTAGLAGAMVTVDLGTGSTMRNCSIAGGPVWGIRVSSGCVLVDNVCQGGNAGIVVEGSNNRIESNQMLNTGIGLSVTGTGNLILKNSCRGNATNYSIAAGNSYGPIVNVAGVGDMTSVTNADHPWANFEY